MLTRVQRMFLRRRTYELLRGHRLSAAELSKQLQLVVLLIIVWVLPILVISVWLLQYYTHNKVLAIPEDTENLTISTSTQGFFITMINDTVWKVAEHLNVAFRTEDMYVVIGHVGNESTLSLYNRFLMRHGRTDTLQIENLKMLGCLERHREVWTRVQQDSNVFEDDTVPVKQALSIVKTLLNDTPG